MKNIRCRVNAKKMYLIPIGDVHIGDVHFGKISRIKLKEVIDFVRRYRNARVILMGDILNVATTDSKSSVFDQDLTLEKQIKLAVTLFKPIRRRIIGAIEGNHELRLKRFVGYSPTISICERLDIPYLGHSAVAEFLIGSGKHIRSYVGYFHHTTGGGATPGGALNRINKLRHIVVNADFYAGGHNHQLGAWQVACVNYEKQFKDLDKKIVYKKQTLIDCGSYLEWNESYAEEKMFSPSRLGSPRITMEVKDHGRGFEVRT